MLPVSLVKEEKKENKDFRACLCQDQVEEMVPQVFLAHLALLGSQVTQMALWSVSLDHPGIRVLLGLRGIRD